MQIEIVIELRRLYSDIITLYKIIHGFVDSSISNSLLHRDVFNVTHGHCYKLKKVHVRLDVRKHFLANRVVNVWNNLPNDVVQQPDSQKIVRFILS